jgi:hypothetical protein
MITTWLHAPNHPSAVLDETDAPLEEVLHDVRVYWNEEEGPQLFWFTDEQGNILATMLRHETDSEIAITTYANGEIERHRCEYLFNENGGYEATEIRKLPAQHLS